MTLDSTISPICEPYARVRPPFSYFGSKSRHLKFIGPLLPGGVKIFVEPFGGSASVLLSRPPAPIETYNDISGELVNFFRVLRDDFDAFQRAVDLTPYNREEFEESLNIPAGASQVERARLFFLRASAAYAGRSGVGHVYFTTSRNELRRGIPDRVSRYLSAVDNLQEVATRFRNVQIENLDALDLIRKYDTPDTLFYLDPPYLSTVRKSTYDYDFEVGDIYHRNLATVLGGIKGLAAISGYSSPLYESLFSGWTKHIGPVNRSCETHRERQEILWTNYDPGTGQRLECAPDIVQKTINFWGGGSDGGGC